MFPAIIPFKIPVELSTQLNDKLQKRGYKHVSEAKVYNIAGSEEVVNHETRYNSWKCEFENKTIRNIISKKILPQIASKLNTKYKDRMFYLSLGEQKLDYVVYRNGGFFNVHHDFVAIQSEGMCQYTCLIGLTNDETCEGGETTIYTKIKDPNDFAKIVESNPKCKLFHTSGEPIGMPQQYNAYKKGNCLMFKSELFHAGEPFYGNLKELLMITINVTCVSLSPINNLSESFSLSTLDNKTFVIPKQFLRGTMFESMSKFYDSDILKTEMLSTDLNAILEFINSGTHSENELTNSILYSCLCVDYRYHELGIPKQYHKKIHDWKNSHNSIIYFDKFDPFMIEFVTEYNLVPFQIILCESSVNRTTTEYKFITYFNFEESIDGDSNTNIMKAFDLALKNIYNRLKSDSYEYNRIEKRQSEGECILAKNTFFAKRFKFPRVETENKAHILQEISDFSATLNFDDDFIFHKSENINGKVLEYEWCNDGGYHYYENTTMYFSCKVDVKYCFLRLF